MQISIQNFLAHCKTTILVKIDEALAELQTYAPVKERLAAFMRGGKMIRGALVRLGALFGNISVVPDDALDWAGAAMEFFQAGLLIHDDIMDRDSVRRGMPTVYWQYAEDAKHSIEHSVLNGSVNKESFVPTTASVSHETMQDVLHYGEAQGICAGDIAFFLGYYSLQHCVTALAHQDFLEQREQQGQQQGEQREQQGTDPIAFTALELCKVGLAQMLDVTHGTDFFKTEPSLETILEVYRYKTGRYTFSLPLSLGARLAGADISVCNALEDYGEQLGIVFQLKDDELGIFAPPEKLGKVSGADIRENKKTVHRKLLFDEGELPEQIKMLFGKKDLTASEIHEVQDTMRKYNIVSKVQNFMKTYIEKARNIRKSLHAACTQHIKSPYSKAPECGFSSEHNVEGSNAVVQEDCFVWLDQLERYSLLREF